MIERSFQGEISTKIDCSGVFFLPETYDAAKSWPLFIFLGPQGFQNAKPRRLGWNNPYHLAPEKYQNEFIFCSVAGDGIIYDPNHVYFFIQELSKEYNIDLNRVYLSGYSYGARWTYNCAIAYPNLFAGLITIAGASNYIATEKFEHIPLWIFHSEDDQTVRIEESEKVYEVHPKSTFTKFKTGGHNCNFYRIFSGEEIYSWCLKQKRV